MFTRVLWVKVWPKLIYKKTSTVHAHISAYGTAEVSTMAMIWYTHHRWSCHVHLTKRWVCLCSPKTQASAVMATAQGGSVWCAPKRLIYKRSIKNLHIILWFILITDKFRIQNLILGVGDHNHWPAMGLKPSQTALSYTRTEVVRWVPWWLLTPSERLGNTSILV